MMKHTQKTAYYGILLCLCLGLSALENLLALALPLPIPGIKLGLSNLILLFCIGNQQAAAALVLMLLRSLIMSILFGSPITFLFSVLGGIWAVGVMQLTAPLLSHGYSFVTISAIGSFFFQVGQCIAALILYGSAIFFYCPLLLICGTLTGSLLGLIQNRLFVPLKNITKARS